MIGNPVSISKTIVGIGSGAGAGAGSGAGAAAGEVTGARSCTDHGIVFVPEEDGGGKLHKTIFVQSEIDAIINTISEKMDKKSFSKFKKRSFVNGLDYVIDGANVLFSKGNITLEGYMRLDALIQTLKKTTNNYLIVLHNRHFSYNGKDCKHIKKICSKWVNSGKCCSTPRGLDDDWFSIMAAMMYYPCNIITNDQFRDHTFYISDKLKHWRLDYGIEYSFVGNRKCVLSYPPTYSRVIQYNKESDKYFIPIDDNIHWIEV
jgi:hypothetical protein